jgi:uncharacterized protein
MMRRFPSRLLAVAAAAWLAACSISQPTKLYTFADPPSGTKPAFAHPGLAIGISNISLPDYLDRPQIVTRSGATQMEVAEFDRWVEPLSAMTRRTLLQTLRNDLGTDKIVIFPQSRTVSVDYQVAVDVTRFDAMRGGDMTLDARWLVLNSDGSEVLRDGRTVVLLPTGDGTSLQETVNAMSNGWTTLGTEIAQAISSVAGA